jgi:hypothetical protein
MCESKKIRVKATGEINNKGTLCKVLRGEFENLDVNNEPVSPASPVAIKILSVESGMKWNHPTILERLEKEIVFLQTIKDSESEYKKYIVEPIAQVSFTKITDANRFVSGNEASNESQCLVTSFIHGVNLHDFLDEVRGNAITPDFLENYFKAIFRIIFQIAKAIIACHSFGGYW